MAWDILTEFAKGRRHTTYGELGKRMGVHPRTCRFFLGLIQDHCQERDLPRLQSLVVAKSSGRPGRGYIGASTDDIQRGHQIVYAYDWAKTPNPF